MNTQAIETKPRVNITLGQGFPEPAVGEILIGCVENHPRFPFGTKVYTSPVIAIHEDGTAETHNTLYTIKKA